MGTTLLNMSTTSLTCRGAVSDRDNEWKAREVATISQDESELLLREETRKRPRRQAGPVLHSTSSRWSQDCLSSDEYASFAVSSRPSTPSSSSDEDKSHKDRCAISMAVCDGSMHDPVTHKRRRTSRRTLKVEYWDRDEETRERKLDHMDELDDDPRWDSREDFTLSTVLAGKEHHIEENMFPYNCPDKIEHWTLWSRKDLTESQIENLVESWLVHNLPHCVAWGFDDNEGSRSFEVFHVHVYFQMAAQE